MTTPAAQKSKTSTPNQQDITNLIISILGKGVPLYRYKGLTKKNMEAIYGKAYNFYAAKKYAKAKPLFQAMTLYNHGDKRGWMGAGACNQMLKRYQQALAAYDYAATLDNADPLPALHSIECHLALKDYAKALHSLEVVILLSGDQPEFADIKQRSEGMRDVLQKGMKENSIT